MEPAIRPSALIFVYRCSRPFMILFTCVITVGNPFCELKVMALAPMVASRSARTGGSKSIVPARPAGLFSRNVISNGMLLNETPDISCVTGVDSIIFTLSFAAWTYSSNLLAKYPFCTSISSSNRNITSSAANVFAEAFLVHRPEPMTLLESKVIPWLSPPVWVVSNMNFGTRNRTLAKCDGFFGDPASSNSYTSSGNFPAALSWLSNDTAVIRCFFRDFVNISNVNTIFNGVVGFMMLLLDCWSMRVEENTRGRGTRGYINDAGSFHCNK